MYQTHTTGLLITYYWMMRIQIMRVRTISCGHQWWPRAWLPPPSLIYPNRQGKRWWAQLIRSACKNNSNVIMNIIMTPLGSNPPWPHPMQSVNTHFVHCPSKRAQLSTHLNGLLTIKISTSYKTMAKKWRHNTQKSNWRLYARWVTSKVK